ncbi:hypothetical protein [Phenylobacterium sp.]|uniref:hypothetical protein n=1 Tax=Phenylobacterium sp. TaxID=1871053 RepID=UPI002FCBA506
MALFSKLFSERARPVERRFGLGAWLALALTAASGGPAAAALQHGYWWHPPLPISDPYPHYSSMEAACQGAFNTYKDLVGPNSEYLGCFQDSAISAYAAWRAHSEPFASAQGVYGQGVKLACDDGYKRVGGHCELENHPDQSCPVTTAGPIHILTGRKSFQATDFETADGALSLVRMFGSKPLADTEHFSLGPIRGLANWAFSFQYEVQISDYFAANYPLIILGRPGGSGTRFKWISGGAIVPSTTGLPQTDYTLEFLDVWPDGIGNIRKIKSHWRMIDAAENVWLLETFPNELGAFPVALPTRMTAKSGKILTFSYDAKGVLTQITDELGKSLVFTWDKSNGFPRRITQVDLPDSTKLKYAYDLVEGGEFDARLTKVERLDAANAVLDSTTYEYSDTNYLAYVTGIRDRNNVLRWEVTYDSEGRATSSSGPGGALRDQVAYSAPGATFTRTVTNALGKQSVFTFTKTNALSQDPKLTSVVGQVSANCPASSASTTYDSNKFIATTTDEEGRVTGYTRDAKGRPTVIKEAQATAKERVTNITYDTAIDAPSQIVKPGLTTDYTFQTTADPQPPGPPISTTAHAYWRLRMLSNVNQPTSTGAIKVSEIEFRATVGGADQATGGSGIESGNNGNGVANAFDNSNSTYWNAALTPQVHDSWVGYQFAAPVAVNQLVVRVESDGLPRDFVVESSDDGTTWAVEWYVLDEMWPVDAQLFNRSVSPSKTAAYSQWRIRIWQSNSTTQAAAGGQYANLAELEFRATIGGADQATGGAPISNGSINSTTKVPSKAFDDTASTLWSSNNPARTSAIGYSFASPVSVAEVSIQASTTPIESPKDFAIEYFDGSKWHIAKDISNETGWTSGQVRTFTVSP